MRKIIIHNSFINSELKIKHNATRMDEVFYYKKNNIHKIQDFRDFVEVAQEQILPYLNQFNFDTTVISFHSKTNLNDFKNELYSFFNGVITDLSHNQIFFDRCKDWFVCIMISSTKKGVYKLKYNGKKIIPSVQLACWQGCASNV